LTLASTHNKFRRPIVTLARPQTNFLLVKRFDRTEVSGRWRRLHQELLSGLWSAIRKDELPDRDLAWPTLEDMFELTRRHIPSIDIVHLLDRVGVHVL